MQQNRRGGNGWIGWLIFIVLVFGSRFLGPVAAWLSQVTGLQISTGMLIGAVVGLGVVATIVGSIAQEFNRNRRGNQTSLPTGLPSVQPPKVSAPPRPPSSPLPPGTSGTTQMRLPSGEQRLPGPPRFDPIINPRVLTFGVIGLVIFGCFFFAALLLAGSLP